MHSALHTLSQAPQSLQAFSTITSLYNDILEIKLSIAPAGQNELQNKRPSLTLKYAMVTKNSKPSKRAPIPST